MADGGEAGGAEDAPPPPHGLFSEESLRSVTSRRGIDGHHGFALRSRERPVESAAAALGSGVKRLDPAEAAELAERLYADAASKKTTRKNPPPDRHPQGGLTFAFDEARHVYTTSRKPALQMSKEEYTAVCVKQFDEGVPKKKEKYAALMAKYCPGISAADLEMPPARGAKA